MLKNQVRIIAGKWRGRKIFFSGGSSLRPTPDRVRETLFNWLSPLIHDAVCLDLFAGSGALGFEALSRGATSAIFVDYSAEVVRQIQETKIRLQCEEAEIHHQMAEDFLEKTSSTFDIIFLDPPFHQKWLQPCLDIIERRSLVNSPGYLYLEQPREMAGRFISSQWSLVKESHAGQVLFQLFRKN